MLDTNLKLLISRKPLRLPHLKRRGLFVGFSGCSEKSEVVKRLPHPEGCSLISLTSQNRGFLG